MTCLHLGALFYKITVNMYHIDIDVDCKVTVSVVSVFHGAIVICHFELLYTNYLCFIQW